jgi:hypothetical protein
VRARAQALYGPAMSGVRANAHRLAAAARPASDVARAVGHALTAARPRARYRVGQTIHSRLLLALAHLPPWLRDAIIARALPRYPARA